jgi:hypothetical protein
MEWGKLPSSDAVFLLFPSLILGHKCLRRHDINISWKTGWLLKTYSIQKIQSGRWNGWGKYRQMKYLVCYQTVSKQRVQYQIDNTRR